ncbi:MAG: hypothetical protein BWY83_02993 [bacterium ADurb.Bin478]|nr:MAG: hypothetical protein BWY83_02993 [bacterium ADurb.Bin478]
MHIGVFDAGHLTAFTHEEIKIVTDVFIQRASGEQFQAPGRLQIGLGFGGVGHGIGVKAYGDRNGFIEPEQRIAGGHVIPLFLVFFHDKAVPGKFSAIGLELGDRGVTGAAGDVVTAGKSRNRLRLIRQGRQHDQSQGETQEIFFHAELHNFILTCCNCAYSYTSTQVVAVLTGTISLSSAGTLRKSATGLTSF